jgi:hypothetical protein
MGHLADSQKTTLENPPRIYSPSPLTAVVRVSNTSQQRAWTQE